MTKEIEIYQKVKAISLWEPWASLVKTGAKTFETRSWPTTYRGPLVICAAKGGLSKTDLLFHLANWHIQGGLAPLVGKPLDLSGKSWPGICPGHLGFGKALCIVDLVDCLKAEDLTLRDIQADQYFGDFTPGRFAWKLTNVRAFEKPFSVKGKQGLFDLVLPESLAAMGRNARPEQETALTRYCRRRQSCPGAVQH